MSFSEWWNRPIRPSDRIWAALIGGFGGFWMGLLGRVFLGSMPVSLTVLAYWAIGAAVAGVVLGVLFPKATTIVLFPFSGAV